MLYFSMLKMLIFYFIANQNANYDFFYRFTCMNSHKQDQLFNSILDKSIKMGNMCQNQYISEPKKKLIDEKVVEFLYNRYRGIVLQIRQSRIFSQQTPQLQQSVDRYIKQQFNTTQIDKKVKCIDAVHKLHPLQYKNKQIVTKNWLIKACLRQQHFCDKIQLENFNFSQAFKSYIKFLTICKNNPKRINVPTMQEDMIWHSHMQQNEIYKKDMKKFLGKVLGHDDDIPDDKLKEYEGFTKKIRQKFKHQSTTNFTSETSMPLIYGGAYAFCGNNVTYPSWNDVVSSCGAVCGGRINNYHNHEHNHHSYNPHHYNHDNHYNHHHGGDSSGDHHGGHSGCGGYSGGGDNYGGGGGSTCGGGGSNCGGGGGGSTCGGGGGND